MRKENRFFFLFPYARWHHLTHILALGPGSHRVRGRGRFLKTVLSPRLVTVSKLIALCQADLCQRTWRNGSLARTEKYSICPRPVIYRLRKIHPDPSTTSWVVFYTDTLRDANDRIILPVDGDTNTDNSVKKKTSVHATTFTQNHCSQSLRMYMDFRSAARDGHQCDHEWHRVSVWQWSLLSLPVLPIIDGSNTDWVLYDVDSLM